MSRPGRWRRLRVRPFTAGQRRAIALLASLLLIAIVVGLIRNPTFVDDPLPAIAPRGDELQSRLDPNVADARQLAALPNLGERRAADIVAYRDRANRLGNVAFRSADDLLKVGGVGVATTRQIEAYLEFASTRPAATLPSELK